MKASSMKNFPNHFFCKKTETVCVESLKNKFLTEIFRFEMLATQTILLFLKLIYLE